MKKHNFENIENQKLIKFKIIIVIFRAESGKFMGKLYLIVLNAK